MSRNPLHAAAALCLCLLPLLPPTNAARSAPPPAQVITCNGTVTGQLNNSTYTQDWSFSGVAGQQVALTVESAPKGAVAIQLVQGPSRTESKAELGRAQGEAGLTVTLPQTDQYTVVVYGPAPGRSTVSVDYQLSLRCAPPGAQLPPAPGAPAGTAPATPASAPSPVPGPQGNPSPPEPVVPAAPPIAAPSQPATSPALSASATTTTTIGVAPPITASPGVSGAAGLTSTAPINPTPITVTAGISDTLPLAGTAPLTPTAATPSITSSPTGTATLSPTTPLSGTAPLTGSLPVTGTAAVAEPDAAGVEETPVETPTVRLTLPFTVGSVIRWEGLYQDYQGGSQNRALDLKQEWLASPEPNRLRVRNSLSQWLVALPDQKQSDSYEIIMDATTGEVVKGEMFIYTYLPTTLKVEVGKQFEGQGGEWRVSAEKQMNVLGKSINVWIVTNRNRRDFYSSPPPPQGNPQGGQPVYKRYIAADGIQLYYDQATRMYVGGQTTTIVLDQNDNQAGVSLETHTLRETNIAIGVPPPTITTP